MIHCWDQFWDVASTTHAIFSDETDQKSLDDIWKRVSTYIVTDEVELIDICCGSGAATLSVSRQIPDSVVLKATGIDGAKDALRLYRQRFPDALTQIVNLPLSESLRDNEDSSYNLVISQFGVEYGGKRDISKALYLAKKSGIIGLVMHSTESAIYANAKLNLKWFCWLSEGNILKHIASAREVYSRPVSTHTSKDRESMIVLRDVVKQFEKMVEHAGHDVAEGVFSRLLDEVSVLFSSPFEEEKLSKWCNQWQELISGSIERHNGLIKSALSKAEFDLLIDQFERNGVKISDSGVVKNQTRARTLAWYLIGIKV